MSAATRSTASISTARLAGALALALALAGAAACGTSRPAPAAPPPVGESIAEPAPILPAYVEAFDYVWSTIDRTHWDPEKVGAAWDRARAELRPQIARARTASEARAVLEKLLARLGQSHFGIVPAEVYGAEPPRAGGGQAGPAAAAPATSAPEAPAGGPGTTGLDTRLVDGALLVVAVDPDSGGAQAGVKPGWVVRRVAGVPVADIMAAAGKEGDPMLAAFAVRQRMTGPVGGTIELEFDRGAGEPVTLAVKLGTLPGAMTGFGHLPPIRVDYRSRKLGKDAGYIRLSAFFDPARVNAAFAKDLAAFEKTRGIVLDLRGNPGGLGAMAMGMGGHLVNKAGASLGTMVTRESKLKFVLNPQPVRYRGKVAILVDELCMSTCEILAGGLQALGRARVFGVRTPGAALPSQIERLPTGDGFQYAIANYVSASGEPLEGRGVVPDVEVPWDRAALLAGRDPAVDAALAWIRK